MEIANDGALTMQNKARGDYLATLSAVNHQRNALRLHSTWKTVSVSDFPRGRLSVWDLMYRVLQRAVGDRNAPDQRQLGSEGSAYREGSARARA